MFGAREGEIISDLCELLLSGEEKLIEATKWTIKAHLLVLADKKTKGDKRSDARIPLLRYRKQGLKITKGGWAVTDWRKEIEEETSRMEKISEGLVRPETCFLVAAATVAGVRGTTFRCNCCFQEFPLAEGIPVVWCDLPVIIDAGCFGAGRWERIEPFPAC